MPAPLPIPRAEALPLPAPVWLLESLLVLTFFLHVLPMAAVLGGSLLTLVSDLLGRSRPAYRDLADRLSGLLPVAMPATITLGVAPLLFIQLLYGNLFYPATVLMGWPWLSTLGLLILAYYGMYVAALSGRRLRRARTWILLGVSLLVGVVAMVFSRGYAFMLQPERWMAVYSADPRGLGLPPAGAEGTPRFLHALLAAFALAGGYVVAYAAWAGRPGDVPSYAGAGRKLGLAMLVMSLAGQAVVAPWYWRTLPEAARAAIGALPGGTILLAAGPALALLGLVLLALAVPGRPQARLAGLLGALVLALAAAPQAILREVARRAQAVQYLPPEGWEVAAQWGLMAVFALFLVLALGTVVWMVVRYAREREGVIPPEPEPSPGD